MQKTKYRFGPVKVDCLSPSLVGYPLQQVKYCSYIPLLWLITRSLPQRRSWICITYSW